MAILYEQNCVLSKPVVTDGTFLFVWLFTHYMGKSYPKSASLNPTILREFLLSKGDPFYLIARHLTWSPEETLEAYKSTE